MFCFEVTLWRFECDFPPHQVVSAEVTGEVEKVVEMATITAAAETGMMTTDVMVGEIEEETEGVMTGTTITAVVEEVDKGDIAAVRGIMGAAVVNMIGNGTNLHMF